MSRCTHIAFLAVTSRCFGGFLPLLEQVSGWEESSRLRQATAKASMGIGAVGVSWSYAAVYSSDPPRTVVYRQYASPGISPRSRSHARHVFRSRRCSQAHILPLYPSFCLCAPTNAGCMGTARKCQRPMPTPSACPSSSARLLNCDAPVWLLIHPPEGTAV